LNGNLQDQPVHLTFIPLALLRGQVILGLCRREYTMEEI